MARFVFDWDSKYELGIVQSDVLDILREAMSMEDINASIGRYRKNRKWFNIRKYAITSNGRFYIGIFPEIYECIKNLNIPYTCIITDKFKQRFKCGWIDNDNHPILEMDISPRHYQTECVLQCLKYGWGVSTIGTAGGKTMIIAMLIHNINSIKKEKTLIITSPSLMKQMYSDFIDYGLSNHYSISMWDSNRPYRDTDIVIASYKILMSKKQDIGVLNDYGVLIIDECHSVKSGREINKIIKKIKTPHKFGFTGSLPDSKIDIWNITGKLGPVIYKRKREILQKEGYVSSAHIVVLKIKYTPPPVFEMVATIDNPTSAYNEECDFIYKNEFRNKIIGSLVCKLNKNTLILVDRLEHQQIIMDAIQQYAPHKNIQFVRGEVEMDDREKIRRIMEENNDVVCVAMSSIFATGINIKNIHNIIFALIGKSKLRILQSIGRGLRLHKDKIKLTIFDLADCLYYGLKHLEQRLELYQEENIDYVIKTIKEK